MPSPVQTGLARVLSAARRSLPVLTAGMAALSLPTVVAAEEDDWDITLGAGTIYEQDYAGSDSYSINPVPFVDITWRDRIFLNGWDGLGAYLIKEDEAGSSGPFGLDEFEFGVSIRPTETRDSGDDSRLSGLDDIDLSAEIGAFGAVELGPMELGMELYQDIGSGHEGLHGQVTADFGRPIGKRLYVEAGPYVAFGDSQYMESFYGVTASQSGRSGFSTHDAGSGIYGAGLSVMGRVGISEHWGFVGTLDYMRLLGDAADSPIVENENGFQAGAFLTYTF